MTISINDEVCEKYSLSTTELFALLLIKSCDNLSSLFESLESKKIIVKDMFGGYMVTQRWDDVASSILLDSDKNRQSPERVEQLAAKLMEIFPKEKKAGTCHYFRGNKKDNILRLKKFFKLYGKYTDEQILDAARKYVTSFNGNYSYMRILKYFIWKDDVKMDAEGKRYVDEVSDLANWIENDSCENNSNSDWTVILK
jgi:hypothetical protein